MKSSRLPSLPAHPPGSRLAGGRFGPILLTLAGLLVTGLWTGASVHAQQTVGSVTVTCTDAQGPESCTIASGDPRVLDEATLAAIGAINSCVATGESSAECRTPDGSQVLSCSEITETSAVCSIAAGPSNTVFNCTSLSEAAASCTVERSVQPAVQDLINESLSQAAATPPQREVGRVIGTICPKGIVSEELQRDCNAVVGGAIGGDPGSATALDNVTPDEASAPLDASQTSINVQTRNIAARQAALRRGAGGLSVSGLGFYKDGRRIGAADLPGQRPRGGAAAADGSGDFGRLGVFINGTVSGGDRDPTANEEGFDFDTYGVTLGVDYRVSDDFAAGLALGYDNSEIDLDAEGGGLDSDTLSLTLYGVYYPTANVYLNGSLSFGGSKYDQERAIRYALADGTTVDQRAISDFDGDQWSFSVDGGYELSNGPWTYGPLARLQYIKAEVDGYRERMSDPDASGSGWGLAIDEQDFESLTFSLGGQVSFASSQSWGVLQPTLRAEWVHEFEDDTDFVVGRFLGDPSGEQFRLPTDATDANYFNLGVGVSAVFARGSSAFLFYQATLGFDDLSYYSLGAGVRWEF